MYLLVETETKVRGTDANSTLMVQGQDFTGRRAFGVRHASRAIWESVFCSSLHVSLPCRPPPRMGWQQRRPWGGCRGWEWPDRAKAGCAHASPRGPSDSPVSGAGCLEGRAGPLDAL